MVLWHSINDYAAPQAAVFVMDLLRPDSMETAHALVNEYAINEPPVLQEDFFNSLCASYQTDEVAHQLTQAGLANLQIRIISDRHFIVYGMKQSVA